MLSPLVGIELLSTGSQKDVQNRLLRAMSADDFDLLKPHLRLRKTELHQILIAANTPVEHLFFPEIGFTSITSEGQGKIEVGIIGREGLVGASPVLLGSDRSPHDHFIQSPGEVLSIGVDEIGKAIDQSNSLRWLLLRFVQTLLVQAAQTAFVNATFDIEARLARWLLMCQDRLGGNEFALTHEFLSIMLGVQRTSVTLSLQTLEGSRLIRARRGRIEVIDREQLIVLAERGYGVPEAEYARLIQEGWVARSIPA